MIAHIIAWILVVGFGSLFALVAIPLLLGVVISGMVFLMRYWTTAAEMRLADRLISRHLPSRNSEDDPDDSAERGK